MDAKVAKSSKILNILSNNMKGKLLKNPRKKILSEDFKFSDSTDPFSKSVIIDSSSSSDDPVVGSLLRRRRRNVVPFSSAVSSNSTLSTPKPIEEKQMSAIMEESKLDVTTHKNTLTENIENVMMTEENNTIEENDEDVDDYFDSLLDSISTAGKDEDGNDDDYFDSLLNSISSNTHEGDIDVHDDEDLENVAYRDFPIDQGYVRIPIHMPGFDVNKLEPPPPHLWTAEKAFVDQIVPALYMFIPAALLGFIIGMAIWLVVLSIMRIYSSCRKTVENRNTEPQTDIINDIKNQIGDDPWKKISDKETVHGLDGSMRKDRLWHLRNESRKPVIGGSDRKPKKIKSPDDSRISSMSAGKNMLY